MDAFIAVLSIMVFLMDISSIVSDITCSRRDSRIAQEIIEEVLVPVFDDISLPMPPGCPLDPSRNMYRDNEQHKLEEDPHRWSCQYCGKAFGSQGYLDDHFQNRHSDTILQPPTGICLAQYCDILRCEVTDHRYVPRTNCNHTLMELLHTRCTKTVKLCVPPQMTGMKKYSFINDLRLAVCEYLTCEKYDEIPLPKSSPFLMFFAVMVGISFLFGAIIFFLLSCTDVLMTEPRNEDGSYSHRKRKKEKYVAIRIPGGNGTIRHRHRDETDEEDDDDGYR